MPVRTLILAALAVFLLALPAQAGPMPDCCSPKYKDKVMQSYRDLQYRMSIYGQLPEKGKGLRLGVYQAQAAYGPGATDKNLARLENAVKQAARFEVQLLSFPELYLPGYTLSPEEARKVAQYSDGPAISKACEIAAANKMALLVPFAEKADIKGKTYYFDSIAVIDAQGKLLFSYRKTHLYAQQERDNWSFGDKLAPVFEVNGLPVGVLNCYECEFPELSRILALRGAKLIVGPTAADCYYTLTTGQRSNVPYPDISELLIPAYAYANNIFFAYSNRCGTEARDKNEWHYRGNSIVCGPHGDVIVQANHQRDTMLVADIIPGYYGMTHPEEKYDYLKDRRPGMYKDLVAPKAEFIKGGWTYPKYIDGKEVPPRK